MKAYALVLWNSICGMFLKWPFNFRRKIHKFSATLAPPIWMGWPVTPVFLFWISKEDLTMIAFAIFTDCEVFSKLTLSLRCHFHYAFNIPECNLHRARWWTVRLPRQRWWSHVMGVAPALWWCQPEAESSRNPPVGGTTPPQACWGVGCCCWATPRGNSQGSSLGNCQGSRGKLLELALVWCAEEQKNTDVFSMKSE